jgi:hypothetical protein
MNMTLKKMKAMYLVHTYYILHSPDLVSCFQSPEFPGNGSGNQSVIKQGFFLIMPLRYKT